MEWAEHHFHPDIRVYLCREEHLILLPNTSTNRAMHMADQPIPKGVQEVKVQLLNVNNLVCVFVNGEYVDRFRKDGDPDLKDVFISVKKFLVPGDNVLELLCLNETAPDKPTGNSHFKGHLVIKDSSGTSVNVLPFHDPITDNPRGFVFQVKHNLIQMV